MANFLCPGTCTRTASVKSRAKSSRIFPNWNNCEYKTSPFICCPFHPPPRFVFREQPFRPTHQGERPINSTDDVFLHLSLWPEEKASNQQHGHSANQFHGSKCCPINILLIFNWPVRPLIDLRSDRHSDRMCHLKPESRPIFLNCPRIGRGQVEGLVSNDLRASPTGEGGHNQPDVYLLTGNAQGFFFLFRPPEKKSVAGLRPRGYFSVYYLLIIRRRNRRPFYGLSWPDLGLRNVFFCLDSVVIWFSEILWFKRRMELTLILSQWLECVYIARWLLLFIRLSWHADICTLTISKI